LAAPSTTALTGSAAQYSRFAANQIADVRNVPDASSALPYALTIQGKVVTCSMSRHIVAMGVGKGTNVLWKSLSIALK
jgi:hypothetical protein